MLTLTRISRRRSTQSEDVEAMSRARYVADKMLDFAAGLVGALVVVIFVAFRASSIADLTVSANPSCDDPRGLTQIARTEITAAGPSWGKSAYGTNGSARNAIDGRPGSIWLPPQGSPSHSNLVEFTREARGELHLTLRKEHNIVLVCVANGLGNDSFAYLNWGRVRGITSWGASKSKAEQSVMRSLGPDNFQNLQTVAFPSGVTTQVNLEPRDAYYGQALESFDPDRCLTSKEAEAYVQERDRALTQRSQPRFDPGCIVEATPAAGLSEVVLYERSEQGFLTPIRRLFF
jgi:hypothetical protein